MNSQKMEEMMSNKSRKWADLPIEILELIGKGVETRIEVYRFRAVCRSWRSVLPLSANTAPLSPPFHLPPSLRVSSAARLSPVFFCRLQHPTASSSSSSFVKVTQSSSGQMKIMDPFSSVYTIRDNSLTSPKTINILNLRLVHLSRGYRLKFKHRPKSGVAVSKLVLFDKSGVLMIYGAGVLAYFGFKGKEWIHLGGEGTKYDDIVVYKGQYYVVDTLGTVYWVDVISRSVVQYSPPLFGLGQVKNLVVSDGELFVVDSYCDDGDLQRPPPVDNFERVDMRMYRLDEEWGTWVDVHSLGDRFFLLANEVCFSVSTKDILGCSSRNCVYFSEPKKQDRYSTTKFKLLFARVFDIEDHRRMKTVDCWPSHRKLFDLLMNFPCALSPPEFPRESPSAFPQQMRNITVNGSEMQ